MNIDTKRQNRQIGINLVLCGLMIFFCLGFASANKSLYLAAITDALDIKRSAYSLATSCRFVATAVVNVFFAQLLKRFGYKPLMMVGYVLLIGSMVLNVVATTVWMFCISEVLCGIAFSWVGTPMVGSIVNRCCKNHTGTVMGAILAASGVGGAVAAQVMTPIIYQDGNPFGYRTAYCVVAGILLVMAVTMLLFFKEKAVYVSDDVPSTKSKKARGQSWSGIEFSRACRSWYFYGAVVCVFLCGVCMHGANGVGGAHLLDVGMDKAVVATVGSVSSLMLTVSKFTTGVIYDRIGLRGTFSICCGSGILAFFLLGVIENTAVGVVLSMVYALLVAFALPLETVMIPLYAKDMFGDKSYDRLMGLFYSFNTLGYAVGGPLVNLGFDMFGTYKQALLCVSGILVVVLVGFQFIETAAHNVRRQVTGSSLPDTLVK